jgi:hypothetical protein
MSLKAALLKLGYRSYHMEEAVVNVTVQTGVPDIAAASTA